MKRSMKRMALLIVTAAIGYSIWWGIRMADKSERISRISMGDTEDQVLAIVGQPVKTNAPPDHTWCSASDLSHEYMYGTSVVASWDVIGFNKDGRVVCKVALQSP